MTKSKDGVVYTRAYAPKSGMKITIRGFIPVRKSKAIGHEFGVSHEFNVSRNEAELYARTGFDKENPVDRIAPCTLTIETVQDEW